MYWKCLFCQPSVAVSDWQLPTFILYGILHIDIQFPVFLTLKDSNTVGYFAVLTGTYLQMFRKDVNPSFTGSSSSRKVTSVIIYQSARRNVREVFDIHEYRCENLKSHFVALPN
jgi:hypothetical protein